MVCDECVDTLDQIVVALRHLLNVTPPVVPRDVLDVEDLEEFELHEVVVGMSVLLGKCVGDKRLYIGRLLVG